MKIRILDRTWKVSVLSGDAFQKRFNEALDGITLPETLEIVYCADDFNLATVKHEAWHAYFSSLCLDSTQLSQDQLEEVSAELMARYGEQMLKQSKAIYNALKDHDKS